MASGEPGGHPLLERASLEVGDFPSAERLTGGDFDLRLEEGTVVRISTGSPLLRIVPAQERSGTWSELAGWEPAARLATAAEEPPAGAECIVRTARVLPGDRLVVAGEMHEGFVEGSGGMREAPEQQRSLRAMIIAGGPEPDKSMARAYAELFPPLRGVGQVRSWRRLRSRGDWIGGGGLLLGAVGCGVTHALIPPGELQAEIRSACVGVGSLLLALFIFGFAAPSVLAFRSRDEEPRAPRTTSRHLWGWTFGALLFTAFTPVSFYFCYRWVLLGTAAAWILILALLRWHSFRETARISRRLLAAPSFGDAMELSQWGSIVGTVRDPTPVTIEKQPAALGLEGHVEHGSGSDPDLLKSRLNVKGSFYVLGPSEAIEVFPKHACWATTEGRWQRVGSLTTFHELIPDGGRALVAGYLTRAGQGEGAPLRMVGEDGKPLVIFATAADADPEQTLRREVLVQRLVFALLLALVPLSIVGAIIS